MGSPVELAMGAERNDAVPPIAVAIVSYNTRQHLRRCLASVLPQATREIVVVDNGSTDGSVEMVRSEFPTVALQAHSSNPGYGAAANAAVAACQAPYVLLLNADTELRPHALDALAAYLDGNPSAAVVGPRLLNPDGTLQRSCYQFPTPLVLLLHYSSIGVFVCRIPGLRALYLGSFAHDRARRVPWVMGAALAIRRSAFELVGGFDPSFFMYYEEVDLSYRLHLRGWETHFAPVTDVTHVGGASTSQRPVEWFLQQLRSGLHYTMRHHSRSRVWMTAFVMKIAILNKLLAAAARYPLTNDAAQRRRLAENVGRWRRLLREPWRLGLR